MWYKVLRNIISVVYHLVYRFEVTGTENIPKDGGVILCGNHRSNNDAIFLAVCQKRQIAFMGKDSLFKIPVLGFVLKKVGAFAVKRGTGDIGAIRKAVEILNGGNMLSIFPEGTRNKTAEPLIEFKTGAVFIAYKADAYIVPVGISGRYVPFSKVRITFGEPFKVSSETKPDLNSETQILKDKVLCLM